MPLFGSSNKHNNDTANTDMDNTGAGGRHHVQPTTQHPGAGMSDMNTFGQTQASGPGANYDNNFQAGSGQGGQFGGAQDDPYTAGGVGSGRQGGGGRGMQDRSMDTNTHGSSQMRSGGQGAGGHLGGNIEPAPGTGVGSDALKQKLAQKEQEAKILRLQGGELAEAERLEQEALKRRERAVAHGADPMNSTHGAGNTGGASAGRGPGV